MKRLARAILGEDETARALTRKDLVAEVGPQAASFVVGVAAFFDAINRLADGTGTKLDEEVEIPGDVDLSAMGGMGF